MAPKEKYAYLISITKRFVRPVLPEHETTKKVYKPLELINLF
jgi:hypothetical protein